MDVYIYVYTDTFLEITKKEVTSNTPLQYLFHDEFIEIKTPRKCEKIII